MSTAKARALLAERNRREKLPAAVAAVRAGLFDLQRQFAESPHRRKVMHPGRRSGKTHGLLDGALDAAVRHPGTVVPVFERTLTCRAADTFWRALIEIDTQFKLGIDFHHTYKTATLPNRSVIALLGADTIEAADKHRGGKHAWAAIDEAGTFRSRVLEYLLVDVLEPATADYNGTIVVAGTPGLDPVGCWYDLCHNRAWERWHWTMLDNPTWPADVADPDERRRIREQWMADLRARHGWTEDTARYRREYLGLWVHSAEDKCYQLGPQNYLDALPEVERWRPWRYWLALDLGFDDPTAFVVLAARDNDPGIYVVESYEQSGLIPSAVAAHVERLQARYQFVGMWADTGGYGKAVAVEMAEKYGLPVQAAKKRDKRVYMEHARGLLLNGRAKIVRGANRILVEDLCALGWNDDRTNNDDGQRDHLPDAFLYGVRHAPVYQTGLGDRDPPARGTPEWAKAREAEIVEQWEQEVREELDAQKTYTLFGDGWD